MQKSEGAQYYVVCTLSNLLRKIKVSEPALLPVASKIMQYAHSYGQYFEVS